MPRRSFMAAAGLLGEEEASAYEAAVLALSPLGYYRLDETSGSTAADSSGNGYDATYTGGTLDQSPLIQDGKSVLLDGSDDSVDLPAQYGGFGSGDWTGTAWINLQTDGIAQRVIGIGDSSAGNFGWYMSVASNNRLVFFWYDDTDSVTSIQTLSTVSAGTTAFIAVVRDGGNSFIYLDGVQRASGSNANNGTLNSANSGQYIGRQGGGTPIWLDGQVDEVAIFDYALSSAEIDNLNSVGRGL